MCAFSSPLRVRRATLLEVVDGNVCAERWLRWDGVEVVIVVEVVVCSGESAKAAEWVVCCRDQGLK